MRCEVCRLVGTYHLPRPREGEDKGIRDLVRDQDEVDRRLVPADSPNHHSRSQALEHLVVAFLYLGFIVNGAEPDDPLEENVEFRVDRRVLVTSTNSLNTPKLGS